MRDVRPDISVDFYMLNGYYSMTDMNMAYYISVTFKQGDPHVMYEGLGTHCRQGSTHGALSMTNACA